MSKAIDDVLAERRRQIDEEGFDAHHDDDANDPGELARAGASYAINAADKLNPYSQGDGRDLAPEFWPWLHEEDRSGGRGETAVLEMVPTFWKPTTARRDLVKAAALIIAEIEQIDRNGE